MLKNVEFKRDYTQDCKWCGKMFSDRTQLLNHLFICQGKSGEDNTKRFR